MQSREKKIIKNSLIFTVGNLGSKFFSYFMVLVYTYYITSAELGYYDVVLTTISLLQPIVLLSFDEGIYRWLIDAEERNVKKVISTCVKTVLCTTFLTVAIFSLINIKLNLQYALSVVFLFATALIYQLAQNAVRGLGSNKLYALSGVVNSFLLLFFEIIGIIVLNMGVEALFISKVAANILTLLFIYCKEPRLHGFLKEGIDKHISSEMTRYTIPLIPNSISWWIVNSSDRYIILACLGASFNGIYTVANKFPTVITTISGIIYFALQEAVIKEYKSPDRDRFYSTVFEKYYSFLFGLVLCGIPSTKVVITLFTGSDYKIAWQYTSFLFISTVFSALSSFLGIGYQISRDTKKSAYTTISAAVINILLNCLLVRFIGLHAATLSTLLSYVILFVIRIFHCRKYFTLKVKWNRIGVFLVTSLLFGMGSFIGGLVVNIILLVVGVLFLLIDNKQLLCEYIKKRMVK